MARSLFARIIVVLYLGAIAVTFATSAIQEYTSTGSIDVSLAMAQPYFYGAIAVMLFIVLIDKIFGSGK